MAFSEEVVRRIYGGWLGKAIGVAYGAPVEGWTYEQIRAAYGDLVAQGDRFYLTPMDRLFGADDDTSHPLLMLHAVAESLRAGAPQVPAPRELGHWWLNLLPEDHGVIWRGGYGVSTEDTAFQNLLAGIEPPASGSAALNGTVVSQQIGGQIFSDIWGLLAPGDPERAAAWADAAASVSHDLDGRLGARFVAAMVSLAFRLPTAEAVVRQALALLPPEARYTRVMEEVYRFWEEHPDDWERARDSIAAHHGYDRYPGICHIIPNAAVVTLALLYGGGDFDRTLRIANAAGWDTDCNVGNAGAVVGVLVGPEGIAAPWREPLRDQIVGSGVLGARNLVSMAGIARLTAALARALAGEAPGGKDPVLETFYRASFDEPGATEGFATDPDPEQALAAVRPSQRVAAAGQGSLQLVVRDLGLHRPARVIREVLLEPSTLASTGYHPAFSPVLYPGGTVSGQLSLPAQVSPSEEGGAGASEPGILAGFFVDLLEPGEEGPRRRRLWAERFTPLSPGRWVSLSWRIPEVEGLVARLGIELRAARQGVTYTGPLYLDEVRWEPGGRFGLAFQGWPQWYGAAAGWTYSKGLWQVEEGAYVGSAPDHGESFTGSPDWAETTAEADLVPQWGSWHLVLVRVQGARRWYGAALAPGGQLAIVKQQDGHFQQVASTPFPWQQGRSYRVRAAARGAEITAWAEALPGDGAAESTGSSGAPARLTWTETARDAWQRGCVGLGVREGSRLACRAIRVEGKA